MKVADPVALTPLQNGVEERILLRGALYVMLAALMLSPLLWTAVPALVDYPVHLARMWILALRGKNPEIVSNYLIHWRLVPNLAMDLIVPVLAQVMPIDVAGRLFIALTMLAMFGGTVALHRALYGYVGLWPACSLLFVYNAALFWGFLNFLFGLGIFLLTFSGWVATREWRVLPRLALFAAAASLLLILHLFAFGLYGMSVMSYETARHLNGWRLTRAQLMSLCLAGLQFVPALLLVAVFLPSGAPMFTSYGNLLAKQYALVAPLTFGWEVLAFDKLLVFFCVGFLIFAIATRSLSLVPEMRLPLVAMAVTAILMPNWLSGSWAADIRVPITLPFVIIASTRLHSPWRRTISAFAMVAIALLGTRIWSVTEIWWDYDLCIAEFRAATRIVSPGARLLLVENQTMPMDRRGIGDLPMAIARRSAQMFWHVPALAVIDRAAFIPSNMFTGWTAIDPNPRNMGLFETESTPPTPEELRLGAETAQSGSPASGSTASFQESKYWRNWRTDFDFVVWIDFGQAPDRVTEYLQPLKAGTFFHIYRVTRP